ncbi:MAG: RNA polymerase sigma factor [Sphingobacterium sp.]|uniref:RNA polymerase sigma factor n=1 Tax=Sphingobacterium sp. JB170 TaxID=1434842 RepID=UPI00097ECD1D|nr:sigma-70 family RNA polymerase sigma factor [Sphingobacterium sp. JB170]SJN35676.1 RNA polymerase ECF-type sigma factor [Sphingobacterium sp. JB170]
MFSNKRHLHTASSEADEQLWVAIAIESCSTSFGILFDRYWSMIFTTAFSYTKDRQLSETITHDIFVNLWDKRCKLQINSFPTYLRMAARYHVYKDLKSRKKRSIQFVDQWEIGSEPHAAETADANLGYQDTILSIHSALSILPARCQQIFRMSRFEQLSNDEIAHELGISKRSVENQITRALHFLREKMKPIISILLLLSLLS